MQFDSLTEMLFQKVFDYYIRCVVWVTILMILTSLFFNSSAVMGRSTKLAFDEEKDVETFKVTTGDNSEQMFFSASSNVDRRSRVKLFDDIFNVSSETKVGSF